MTLTNDRPRARGIEPRTTVPQAVGPTYFPLAFVARLPFAMMVVGVLTLVVAATDSLTLGGATSGMVGLGAAVCGPLIGAWADRSGQRRALLATAVVHSILLLVLTLAVFLAVPAAVVLAVGFSIGASAPQVPPMSRSRLTGVIRTRLPAARRPVALSRTMSYEATVDEVVFVFGPFVVGALATLFGPAAPILAASALTALAVGAFALHSSGRVAPPPGPSARTAGTTAAGAAGPPPVQAPVRELFSGRVLVLVAGFLGIGLFFGSVLTALSAYTGDAGHSERAGLLYGFMGIGSALTALAVVVFPARFSLRARWLVFAVVQLAGAVVVATASSTGMLLAGLLIAGLGIGPSLVTIYSLGSERSPVGRTATVMTMLGSAIILGQSAASAATGLLADTFGTSAAMAVPVVAAGVVAGAAAANWRLGRAPAAVEAQASATDA